MNHLTRRNFAKSVITSLAAIGCSQSQAIALQKQSPIIDTHVHCFAGNKNKDFPYHSDGPYQPDAITSPQILLEQMKKAGVDFAVVVHPEPYQDDHRYLEYCLSIGKKQLKGTCLFFANKGDSARLMGELVKRNPGKIVALRFHAYNKEKLPPFEKPELRILWKAASELGLNIQLHFEPRYAAGFEPLIKEFSKTKVIIDHMGRPFDGSIEENKRVLEWIKFENTIMKVSSLPDPKMFPDRDAGKVIKDLVNRFTPMRLIYGGGFDDKSDAQSYRAYRENIRSYLAALSSSEQAMILGGNAQRLFGFES
ncbi:MAG: amidohydrolase family protein [Gemmataceae bacterium]